MLKSLRVVIRKMENQELKSFGNFRWQTERVVRGMYRLTAIYFQGSIYLCCNHVPLCVCLSHSVVSDSLPHHGL